MPAVDAHSSRAACALRNRQLHPCDPSPQSSTRTSAPSYAASPPPSPALTNCTCTKVSPSLQGSPTHPTARTVKDDGTLVKASSSPVPSARHADAHTSGPPPGRARPCAVPLPDGLTKALKALVLGCSWYGGTEAANHPRDHAVGLHHLKHVSQPRRVPRVLAPACHTDCRALEPLALPLKAPHPSSLSPPRSPAPAEGRPIRPVHFSGSCARNRSASSSPAKCTPMASVCSQTPLFLRPDARNALL